MFRHGDVLIFVSFPSPRSKSAHSTMDRVMTMLICGRSELTELFIFEGAMQWAKEGNRVLYITQSPLESLPTKYHDGSKPNIDIFQMITFMYIPDYQRLMELLVTLDTFATLPTALFIDKFENYCVTDQSSITDSADKEDSSVIVARTCAFVIDTLNACSRIAEKTCRFCATANSDAVSSIHLIYFNDIWCLSGDDKDGKDTFVLQKLPIHRTKDDKAYRFETLRDGSVVLVQILKHVDATNTKFTQENLNRVARA